MKQKHQIANGIYINTEPGVCFFNRYGADDTVSIDILETDTVPQMLAYLHTTCFKCGASLDVCFRLGNRISAEPTWYEEHRRCPNCKVMQAKRLRCWVEEVNISNEQRRDHRSYSRR